MKICQLVTAVWIGLILVSGCGSDDPPAADGGVDATTRDASTLDGGPGRDGTVQDASILDGGTEPDGAVPPGDLIWEFFAGDLDKAVFDTYVATMPLGSEGRPQPENNSYRLVLPTPPQQFAFAINYEVPELLGGGDNRVRTFLPEVPQNRHNMFRMYNPDRFLGGIYMKMHQAYKFEFEADFSGASDWANISWCIFFQIWGAAYPGSWGLPGHPLNPPVALSLDSGEFEIRVYGEHVIDLDTVAGNTGWTHSESANWAFTPGPHFFEVWVTSDYREPGSGGIGAIRVDMDGITRYESSAIVNAFKSQVSGQDSGGLPMLGVYSYTSLPAPTYADVIFDRVRIYEL